MSRRIMRVVPWGSWWAVKCADHGDLNPLWAERSEAEKQARNHRRVAHKDEPVVGYDTPRRVTVKANAVIHYPVEAPVRHRHPFVISDLPGIGATVARGIRESA